MVVRLTVARQRPRGRNEAQLCHTVQKRPTYKREQTQGLVRIERDTDKGLWGGAWHGGCSRGRYQRHLTKGVMMKCTSNQCLHPVPAEIKRALFEPYAWPGGYPLYAVTSDGTALCCTCLRKKWRHIGPAIRHHLYDGWRVEAVDVNWEDPSLYCDQCNKRIESAYAE